MTSHIGASTRELISELARLDDAVRAATPFLNAPDHAADQAPEQASALSPQFLDC